MKRLALCLVALVAACTADTTSPPQAGLPFRPLFSTYGPSCGGQVGNRNTAREEEIWGCVWGPTDGLTAQLTNPGTNCTATLGVSTDGYIAGPNDDYGNAGAHWGWYGQGDQEYPPYERHGGGPGSGAEAHCVAMGAHTLTLSGGGGPVLSVALDYINFSGPGPLVEGGSAGGMDLIVNYDASADTVSPQAHLNVSAARTATASWAELTHGSTPLEFYIPSNMVLRISGGGSISHWTKSRGIGELLMRVYWDYPNPPTNWVNVVSNGELARALPLNGYQGDLPVAIEVMNPYGLRNIEHATIHVTSPLAPQPASEAQVDVNQTVHFTAQGSSNISLYQWSIVDSATGNPEQGTGWLDWGTRVTYATSFNSAHPRRGILRVKNVSGVIDTNQTYVNVVPAVRTLTVNVGGSGTGTVSSSPAGIYTTSSASYNFATGTQVTLTASPDSPNQFSSWSGCTSGTSSCVVTMDQARTVTANFNPPPVYISQTSSCESVPGTFVWLAITNYETNTYHWFYRPNGGSEIAVGNNKFKYIRTVNGVESFRLRVVVSDGQTTAEATLQVSCGL